MSENTAVNRFAQMRGRPVYDVTGKKIGKVEEIFYDTQTRVPEWLGIGTGVFGKKRVLVPVGGSHEQGDGVAVAYTRDQVKDSPDIDSDELSMQTEYQLASYYGLAYSQERSASGLTEPAPAGRTGGEREAQTVTRAEEELRVGTRPVEAGRAHLRKWVETEPVEADVTLRQETARVTRERLDEPVAGHEFGEEQIDVPLRGEEPIIRKETVAKERIGIDVGVRVEQESVQEQLRKERVEVEVEGADTDEERH